MGPILFSSGDNHTKGLLVQLHLRLEGVTEVDSEVDRFVSFKVTPSNDRVLCAYVASGHNTRQRLAGEHFFEGLQNHVGIKMREMKAKIYLETLIELWMKW